MGREALLLADLAHATPIAREGALAHTSTSASQQASTLSGRLGTAIGILDDGAGGQLAPLRMLSRIDGEFRATSRSVVLPQGHSLTDPFPGFRLRPSAESRLSGIVLYEQSQHVVDDALRGVGGLAKP